MKWTGHRFVLHSSRGCPHAGGLMDKGYVDAAGNVVCPLHQYKFSLKNGLDTSGDGYRLKTYPVEMRDGKLFIGMEGDSQAGGG